MRNLLLGVLILSATACAPADTQRCSSWSTVINGLDLQSSRSWTHTGTPRDGWNLLAVLVNLSQQNTVTRVDMAVTGSDDGNTTDFMLQECEVSSGACTSSDASWQKTVAAADQWMWRVDVGAVQDWQGTISVGAGSGTSTDVITVKTRACTN